MIKFSMNIRPFKKENYCFTRETTSKLAIVIFFIESEHHIQI